MARLFLPGFLPSQTARGSAASWGQASPRDEPPNEKTGMEPSLRRAWPPFRRAPTFGSCEQRARARGGEGAKRERRGGKGFNKRGGGVGVQARGLATRGKERGTGLQGAAAFSTAKVAQRLVAVKGPLR